MHQRIEIIGRVGKKIKSYSGKPAAKGKKKMADITTFTMASAEFWKMPDGKKGERTTWHNMIAYGRMANICEQYVKKGMQIYVEGKISKSLFKDDNGVDRVNVQVAINKVLFLSTPIEKPKTECPHCGGSLVDDANLFDGEDAEDEPLGVGEK